jgi:hypothetical protein
MFLDFPVDGWEILGPETGAIGAPAARLKPPGSMAAIEKHKHAFKKEAVQERFTKRFAQEKGRPKAAFP